MTSMVNAFDILQDRIMRSRFAGDPPDTLVQVRVGKVGISIPPRRRVDRARREAIRKAAAEIREHVELTRGRRRGPPA
jgi:NTE family protein